MISKTTLAQQLADAHARTRALVGDLSDEQLAVPYMDIVNPFLWEIGHGAWFLEFWVLRHLQRRPSILENADELYNSSEVAHDTRWGLELPERQGTMAYFDEVYKRVLDTLNRSQASSLSTESAYFYQLSIFHQDMHTEAFTYMRHTLGYPPPRFGEEGAHESAARQVDGDVELEGGKFWLGAKPGGGFVFDNEKWAHPVQIEPFRMAKTAVSNGQFLEFVEDGGYQDRRWWDSAGRDWLDARKAECPRDWKRGEDGRWRRKFFDEWSDLKPDEPVVHICWFEASAYCRWAGRRLPTEAEWEFAATGGRCGESEEKPPYPWGSEAPEGRASLDWLHIGCLPVGALPAGATSSGLQQMMGNVWEWTSSDFLPYPGFSPDPYKDYSEPWFGTRKVLRGGSWATRSRLAAATYRNFFTPDRRDVFAGFRTCAL